MHGVALRSRLIQIDGLKANTLTLTWIFEAMTPDTGACTRVVSEGPHEFHSHRAKCCRQLLFKWLSTHTLAGWT